MRKQRTRLGPHTFSFIVATCVIVALTIVGGLAITLMPHPWGGLAYLASFVGMGVAQRYLWLSIRSAAARQPTGLRQKRVVHFLETVREYVANEPSELYEFAESVGTDERR
jgi:hypothetical protein